MFRSTAAFSGFAVNDVAQAQAFYTDVLGLDVTRDDAMGGLLTLHLSTGASVLVYPKPDHVPATYTILNFPVEDVAAAARELTRRGVTMLRYEGFSQDGLGVMRGQGPDIAWFTDPAGNVMSVLAADG